MDPADRLIARHHLGDRLHWIGRGGPHADLWIVQAWPDTGYMLSAQGATVDAAAADCAAQLRAGGWVPIHARLEWFESSQWSQVLFLRVGPRLHHEILIVNRTPSGCYYVADSGMKSEPRGTQEEVLAWVEAHVGWLELSLHLPPFHGDKP